MEATIKRTISQTIKGNARLGREIKITPKANISVNDPGYKTEFFIETIELTIGIGRDHTASLVMSVSAWEALKAGDKINITTTEQYKRMYEYKIRKK